jgi:hypothetical protein
MSVNSDIMCAKVTNDSANANRFGLTVKQLRQLRDIERPAFPSGNDAMCGTAGAPGPPDCCPP